MPRSNSTMIHKLQTALNTRFGVRILVNRSQWYSQKQDRPVTTYVVRQATYDEKSKRTKAVDLFKSTSQIQIVLYLRDLWYELNGWEVPTDNEEWERVKVGWKPSKGLQNGQYRKKA